MKCISVGHFFWPFYALSMASAFGLAGFLSGCLVTVRIVLYGMLLCRMCVAVLWMLMMGVRVTCGNDGIAVG